MGVPRSTRMLTLLEEAKAVYNMPVTLVSTTEVGWIGLSIMKFS